MIGTHEHAKPRLWLLDRGADGEALHRLEQRLRLLPDDETARAGALTDTAAAQTWLAGRIGLRLLLAACGADGRSSFVRGASGRPQLPGSTLQFSVSDSGPYLLIGIADGTPIGVDLECARQVPFDARLLTRFAVAARAIGDRSATDVAPLQAWVRIEAFAKAADLPLARCLTLLGIRGHTSDPVSLPALTAQATAARDRLDITVADLCLPHGLTGAIAGRGLDDAVVRTEPLDAEALAALVTHLSPPHGRLPSAAV